MLELIQITNDPVFARRCDRLAGMRLFVDLERLGKNERQAGRNTFITTHCVEDVALIRAEARQSRLMVRLNPVHEGTAAELEAVLVQRPDLLMLPMFTTTEQLRQFCRMVDGRCGVVALLETAQALATVGEWAGTAGLVEIYVGLNDLHISLGLRFMFEPLAQGIVERVARVAQQHGRAFGFGGIARLYEGLLPGREVLAEHARLGSGSVILSRTFHGSESANTFEEEVAALRHAERQLAARSPAEVEMDANRIAALIDRIAGQMTRAA
jgi:hypothetical protein